MIKKKNKLRKEIATLIDSIKEHSDNIGDKPHVAQLELEVILQKIEKLHEKSIVFNYLNSLPEEPNSEKTETINEEKKVTEEVKQKQTTIDLFSMEATIETPKEKEVAEANVSQKFQQSKVGNIKSVIGINEKFQFINDLFEGNTNEYHVAIDQLNTFGDFEEANIYVSNLKDIYQWDLENAVVKNFMDLVKRRFI